MDFDNPIEMNQLWIIGIEIALYNLARKEEYLDFKTNHSGKSGCRPSWVQMGSRRL